MFPRLVYGGFHTVGQDDKLGRPAVVMGAKTYDVDLSHSGRKIARKTAESKGGTLFAKGHFYLAPRSISVISRAEPFHGESKRRYYTAVRFCNNLRERAKQSKFMASRLLREILKSVSRASNLTGNNKLEYEPWTASQLQKATERNNC